MRRLTSITLENIVGKKQNVTQKRMSGSESGVISRFYLKSNLCQFKIGDEANTSSKCQILQNTLPPPLLIAFLAFRRIYFEAFE